MTLKLSLERWGEVFISWAGGEEHLLVGMVCAKALVWGWDGERTGCAGPGSSVAWTKYVGESCGKEGRPEKQVEVTS